MNTNLINFLLILLICTGKASSQELSGEPGPAFGFTAGIVHGQVQENRLNGLVHRGPGVNMTGIYSKNTIKSMQRVELNAGFCLLKTRMESETESFLLNYSVQYSLKGRIGGYGENLDAFIGGRGGVSALQGIYTNWDENHYYWITAYSFGINGMVRRRIPGSGVLSAEFGLPLLSLVSRTPERLMYHEASPEFSNVLDQIHQNPSLSPPWTHFNPEIKLAYHARPGTRSNRSVFWQFSYVNDDAGGKKHTRIIRQSLGIELLF